MARDDTFDVRDNRFDDDGEDERRYRRPRKEGWSTTTKVLLGVLAVCGLSLVLCCGGVVWQVRKFARNMENAMTEDPVRIAEIQKSIAEIDLPADLSPQNGMDMDAFGVMQMKVVVYGDDETGSLMLMEMKFAGLSEEDMEKQFKQQAGIRGGADQPINVESSETRKFTIDGKECRFVFAKGTRERSFQPGDIDVAEDPAVATQDSPPADTTETTEQPETQADPQTPPVDTAIAETPPAEGNAADDGLEPVRQITGMFPSKGGVAFLTMVIPEEKWDEDAVVKMIESIHK